MMKGFKVLCTAAALLGVVSAAQASVVIDIVQSGNNVVATGSGSAITTGKSNYDISYYSALTEMLVIGNGVGKAFYSLEGPSLPFPVSGFFPADSYTGDTMGIENGYYGYAFFVPSDYVSGSSLSGSATWNNTTIAGLGMTPGTYTWSWWGSVDPNPPTVFTLNIGPQGGPNAVPEPSTYALLCISLGVVGYARKKMAKGGALSEVEG